MKSSKNNYEVESNDNELVQSATKLYMLFSKVVQ